MMLLSKVEKIGKDDCCPACKMLRSMLFSRGKIMREMLGQGLYHKEWENIYKNRELLRKNPHNVKHVISSLIIGKSFAKTYLY